MIYTGATPAYNTLPEKENMFETSGQSACISIIVLWGRRPNGEYHNVRARHAQGGVNDPRIFQDVPNELDTQVVIVPGYLYDDPDRRKS
jgi:hypothetical protein